MMIIITMMTKAKKRNELKQNYKTELKINRPRPKKKTETKKQSLKAIKELSISNK